MRGFLEWIGWIAVALVLAMLAIWLVTALFQPAHPTDEPIDDE